MTSGLMNPVDVLVAGAGPAGCAAAIGLARAGLSVRLASTERNGHFWAGESLPPGAGSLIDDVFGATVLVEPHRVAYGVRGAWGSDDLIDTDFIAHPLGGGWHLDRATFDEQLRRTAVDAGAVVDYGSGIGTVARTADGWTVELGATTVRARWLVDATGRAGAVVGRLGIPRTRLDVQVAEVAITTNVDEAAVTTIEATTDGWWYSTPLADDRRVVAFLTDADLRPPRSSTGSFRDRLAATAHISRLVGADDEVAERHTYPADTSYRAHLTGRRWTAVGDAALTWDPLSSQGIVTGVLMGSRAATAITSVLRDEDSPALSAWESDYRMLLDEHEGLRAYYASVERRWPDSPFWRRRRGDRAR